MSCRFLSSSSHELPPWRSPSPAASMIPPPIVQSTYVARPTSRVPVADPMAIDRPLELDDRQQALEADLQFLLDAQADGLIRGLERGSHDHGRSTRSTASAAQSVRASRSIRRQPGLKSARKGIYNSIVALAGLKEEELLNVAAQVRQKEQTLGQIDSWMRKREGLREASRDVDSSEDSIRAQRLRQEADALQVEINAVELHLDELQSRQRKLLGQATAVENAVQARVASYSTSLQQLEADIQRFLDSTPESPDLRSASADGQASVWQLPRKRRNLHLARQYWAEQREAASRQQTHIEFERLALAEGAALWREAVMDIHEFEKELRAGVSRLPPPASPGSQSAWEEPPEADAEASRGLQELLVKLETLLDSVRKKLQTSEDRNWRLLVAALGAEIDALQEGQQMLSRTLNPVSGEPDGTNDREQTVHANHHAAERADAGDEMARLDQSFATTRPISHISDAEDDDEPPPELLFSQAPKLPR